MIKILLGLGAGWVLARYVFAPEREVVLVSEAEAAPLGRQARNVREFCRDFDPMLAQIERAFSDRALTPEEAISLVGTLRTLV